jgi:B12-binding domain/radical SAM domain protein
MEKSSSAVRLPIIFYYHRYSRYSFNALAGALDHHPDLAGWPIHLARTPDELRAVTSAILKHSDHILVAFSVLTIQWMEIRRLVLELRSRHASRITILAGGPHATAHARDTLQEGVDLVFRGEAEASFPEALRRLVRGEDFAGIEGLAFQAKGDVVIRRCADPVDIEAYSSFAPKRGMLGPIEITRGCPFACSYCQTSHIFGAKPRHRSIPQIVGQAATLSAKGRKVVRLLSPNAFSYGSADGRQLNLAAMGELLGELRESLAPGDHIIFGYFPSEVRPEHVTADTLELLRRFANNDEIVIGAQSGSERMLEICRRSHTVRDVLHAVALARKSGFKVIVDFIFGLPSETEQDIRDTMQVINELSRMGARIHVHPFAPLPQTPFSSYPAGRISPEISRMLKQLKERRAIYGDYCESP